jgi:DNA ligase (NAD+)
MPARCPACGAPVEERGPRTYCPDPLGCPAQLAAALVHLASREALDVRGLGGRHAEALVRAGLVRHPADLFRLRPEQLLRLEGFGERSAANLARSIRSRRRPPLDRFLLALGIPGVGEAGARALARRFGSLAALRDADEAALASAPGVGGALAAGVHRFLHSPRGRAAVEELLAAGVRPLPAALP